MAPAATDVLTMQYKQVVLKCIVELRSKLLMCIQTRTNVLDQSYVELCLFFSLPQWEPEGLCFLSGTLFPHCGYGSNVLLQYVIYG